MSEHSDGTTVGSTSVGSTSPFTDRSGSTGSDDGRNDPDWTGQVTDLIVDTVDKVRDRTTGPILDVAHSSVHAVVALIILMPVALVAMVGLVRLLDWAIPGDVWIVYALLGTILSVIGVSLWSLRAPRS